MRELKPHEQALNEAYNNVLTEQSPIASKLMHQAQEIMNKKFKEKSEACKKHIGVVKIFKGEERLKFLACGGRAKASAARAGAAFLEKNTTKCGKEKHCRDTLKHYATQLRNFAKHEEALSAGDEAKLIAMQKKRKK